MLKWILVTIGAPLIALAIWYEASPFYTPKEMRDAACARNAAKRAHFCD